MNYATLFPRLNRSLLVSSLAVFCAVVTPRPATAQATNTPVPPLPPLNPGQTYDLSRDFTLAANPNGAWSYGSLTQLGGTFELLTAPRTFGADNGVPIAVWERSLFNLPIVAKVLGPETAHSDGDHFTAAPGTMYFAPGADGAEQNYGAIRFVVPAERAGNYRLVTFVRSLFDFDRSRDADFHVLKNGEELFGQFLAPNSSTGYSNTLALAAGDTIDFAIGRGADGTTIDTGLKIAATLTLMTTNTPPPVPGQSFDLSTDFTLAANPNGAWRYGSLTQLGGAFELLTAPRTFWADNGVPIAVWERSLFNLPIVAKVLGPETAHSDGNHFTAAPGTMYFAPGADGAEQNYGAIRFVVPVDRAGNYRLVTSVRSLFDFDRSRDADFHVLKNGEELFGLFLAPNSSTGYSNTLALAAGDTIDFAIGRGADGTTIDTGLKIAATLTLVTTNTPPPPPPPLPTFDLATSFSPASNPSGAWSFGWKEGITSSDFDLLSFGKSFGAENGVPIFAWLEADDKQPSVARVMGPGTAVSADGQFVAEPGTVYFTAGDDLTPRNFGVIRFTVPEGRSGTYLLATSVRDLFDGSHQGDTDFHLTRNLVEFFSRSLPPHDTAAFTNLLSLAAGDQIDFLVGRGEDGHQAGSGLKITAMFTQLNSTNIPPRPPPSRGQSFDLSTDFTLEANPNGAWRYGYLNQLGGTFGLLTAPRTFTADNGVPIAVWERSLFNLPIVAKVLGPETAHSDGDHFTAAPGTMYFAPGADGAEQNYGAIRFVVPADRAGNYRVVTSVRSLFDFGRSRDADFHVLRNGQELFGQFLEPNSATSYSNTLALAAGDTIDFAIGRGADGTTADTGLKIAATLTLLTTNTPPPPVPAPSFDLSRDFTLEANPNGAWRYGYLNQLGGAFGLLTAPRTFGADNGVPIAVWERSLFNLPIVAKVLGPETAHSDGNHFTAAAGTMYFAPGADGAPENYGDIRFVVPPDRAGLYRLVTSVRSLFDFERSRDADFHVLKNGQELFGQFLEPNSATSYSNTLALAAGDTIDFAIGRGADGTTADTGLKIAATLTLVTTNPIPPVQQVFDVSNGFSTEANPSGAWRFGWKESITSSNLDLLSFGKSFGAENGVPIFAWLEADDKQPSVSKVIGPGLAISADGQFVAEPGTVYFTAGDDQTPRNFGVIRFTVPAGRSGTFQLATSVRDLFDGSHQGDTDFHITRNRVEFFSQSLPPHSTAGYTNTLSLAAGDQIDFLVGRGEDGHQAGSGLKIATKFTLLSSNTNTPPPPPETNCVRVPTSLAAAWSFNGTAVDSVSATPLQLSGGPVYTAGRVGQALQFDGTNDQALAAASPALNVGEAEGFSIEAWVNPASVTMQPIAEWTASPTVGGAHFWIGVYGSGSLFANLVDTSGNSHSWRSDTDIVVPNQWQHVAMSYEKSSGLLRFYLNGQKVTEHSLGSFQPQTSYPLAIGYRREQEHFNGRMDELAIYRRVLADAEIAAIHGAGSFGKCQTPTTPSTVDELLQLVRGISPPVDAQPLISALESIRASLLRSNLLSALQQLSDFQNTARRLLGGTQPALSAQIISLAQFLIETLDPTGARRSELLAIRNTPMRVERIEIVQQSEGAWRVHGCARPGIVCCIQRSFNLRDWEHAGDATEVSDGIYEFLDVSPGPAPRFYRLMAP